MIIAVDFDGTCVENKFPDIGEEMPHCSQVLRNLVDDGHKLILWTCREYCIYKGHNPLEEAYQWFTDRGVEISAINYNPFIAHMGYPVARKCSADIYIDDCGIGIPRRPDGKIDWFAILPLVWDIERKLNKACDYGKTTSKDCTQVH